MSQYQAVQITAPGQLRVICQDFQVLEPGTVRLRMEAIGLCASDVAVFNGSHPFARYPVISGHEMAGEVVEVQANCPLQVGQRVAVDPMVPCGHCYSCSQQQPNRCGQVQVMGIQLSGGMAEYMHVKHEQLHSIPADMEAELAAMIEPTAVAVHVCNRSGMKAGDRIAVVGTGKIGLLIMAVAKARPAAVLFGVDIVDSRLEHAGAMGADFIALSPQDPVEEIGRQAAAEGFDVVFDTAGEPESLVLATKLARPGGTVVPVALPHAGFPMDFQPFYRKELTLRAARMYTNEFKAATNLLVSGMVDPHRLITHRLPLSEAKTAFEFAANKPDTAVKVIVKAQNADSTGVGATSSREIVHE